MLFHIIDKISVPDSQPEKDRFATIDTNLRLLFVIVIVLPSENRRKTANKLRSKYRPSSVKASSNYNKQPPNRDTLTYNLPP
jgi:hypothetical protein